MEKKTPTLKQSELRKSENWLKNTQRKDKVHGKPCRQSRHTNRSAKKKKKKRKSDRIQMPRTNHTPERHHTKKYMPGSEHRGGVLERNMKILQDR